MSNLLKITFVVSDYMARAIRPLLVACVCLSANFSVASSSAEICSELSGYFASNHDETKLRDPSRKPTEAEAALIESAKIELLEWTDYQMGVTIVDVDNDGKDDILAWNIAGSGRISNAEAYEFSAQQNKLSRKFSISLGVLYEPRFVRLGGINYFVVHESGDYDEGLSVSRISKTVSGQYQRQTLCRMRPILKTETKCKHPACKDLVWIIENKKDNGMFIDVVWPHKYFAPAGLAVYFPEDGSHGDFDNTGNPTSIWRIGRNGYIYQHIYWGLLGQGEEMPEVGPDQRPKSEGDFNRRVLAGNQHARLGRALAQQSEILSAHLHQQISLPGQGEFFLFNAYNRTYWAWDFGDPPYGEEIHITYTNARKSDYIGMLRVKRNVGLEPCASNCIASLDQ